MKLRNKVLVIFFILALSVCLTFVSSANDYYVRVSDNQTTSDRFAYSTNTYNSFESALNYDLGVCYSNTLIGFTNIELWDNLLKTYNITTLEEFESFITIEAVELNYWAGSSFSISYLISQNTSAFYEAYLNYLNTLTYEDGYQQGIEDYNADIYNSVVDYMNYCSTNSISFTFAGYEEFIYSNYPEYCSLYSKGAYKLAFEMYSASEGFTDAYNEGVIAGITQAHEFTSNWLSENNLLSEPIGATGELEQLDTLLDSNVMTAINTVRNDTINYAINALEGWLTSKDLTVKDYNRDFTVNDIDNLIAANFDSAYSEWVKVGRSDAVLRLKTWLNDNNIKYATFENNGLLSDIDNGLNLNVLPALDERQTVGYELGKTDGQALGRIEMFNRLVTYFNETYGTEYPVATGSTYDFGVLQDAYTAAYEAGELYQINKFTDDGGISDFLADISGTVLSTFFYLGTNISFMGTTALNLISLFVIAAIVIFILKFFNKG